MCGMLDIFAEFETRDDPCARRGRHRARARRSSTHGKYTSKAGKVRTRLGRPKPLAARPERDHIWVSVCAGT
jgi:hypothetical protein